jgi:murein L,D-transpeptidase YafK
MPFWRKLKKGYDIFEKTHQPAVVSVSNKVYVFAAGK